MEDDRYSNEKESDLESQRARAEGKTVPQKTLKEI